MHYKITTLVENAVYRRNLQAEHGLSLLIENNGYKILFDTGQSDLLSAMRHFRISRLRKWISLSCHMDIAIIQEDCGISFPSIKKLRLSVNRKPFIESLKINGRTESLTPTCWIYPDSVLSPGRRNLFPDCSYSRTFRL